MEAWRKEGDLNGDDTKLTSVGASWNSLEASMGIELTRVSFYTNGITSSQGINELSPVILVAISGEVSQNLQLGGVLGNREENQLSGVVTSFDINTNISTSYLYLIRPTTVTLSSDCFPAFSFPAKPAYFSLYWARESPT